MTFRLSKSSSPKHALPMTEGEKLEEETLRKMGLQWWRAQPLKRKPEGCEHCGCERCCFCDLYIKDAI